MIGEGWVGAEKLRVTLSAESHYIKFMANKKGHFGIKNTQINTQQFASLWNSDEIQSVL